MRKRFILVFLLLGIVLSGALCIKAIGEEYSRNEIKEAKGYLRSKIMYSQKLYDCTPYQTEFFGEKIMIIGKENSRCHVKIQTTDCYYPSDVAKQYSKISEDLLRKMIDELDTKGTLNNSMLDADAKQMQRINFKYCQLPD